jgi:universal stress protein A
MFKKILIPVDFTSKNKRAIEAASEIASTSNAEVTFLHVIEKIDLLTSTEVQRFYAQLKRSAESKIRKLTKMLGKRANVKTSIMLGNRGEEIVRYAMENRIDLIVMASHKINPTNLNKGWGTLSYKVAILSQCPVLLVK